MISRDSCNVFVAPLQICPAMSCCPMPPPPPTAMSLATTPCKVHGSVHGECVHGNVMSIALNVSTAVVMPMAMPRGQTHRSRGPTPAAACWFAATVARSSCLSTLPGPAERHRILFTPTRMEKRQQQMQGGQARQRGGQARQRGQTRQRGMQEQEGRREQEDRREQEGRRGF